MAAMKKISFPYQHIHEVSMGMLEVVQGSNPDLAILATALTMVRLFSIETRQAGEAPNVEWEKTFTKDLVEWAEAYSGGERGMN
jgi:ubiquinone biosynthesis protein Coq4